MAINYRQCPDCGSKNILKIIYGNSSSAIYRKAEAGIIKLGDGDEEVDSPEYFCNDCEYEWNREQAVDAAYCGIKALKVSVSENSGSYFNLDLDFVHPAYICRHGGEGSDSEEIHKPIRESEASRFADQLKVLHMLDWDAAYTSSDACGKQSWSLEIITGDRIIQKAGYDRFPEEWESFCSEIQKLTGRRPISGFNK